jgi:hypothetical protein
MAWHHEAILANSTANRSHIARSVLDLKPSSSQPPTGPCLIVSAGPSLYREKMLSRIPKEGRKFLVIATDGSYVQCLRAGIEPNYVVTIDPHPTRVVRWFGDPQIERHLEGDDYFQRQDLDVTFRHRPRETNAANISLIDRHQGPLIICSAAPANVVARTAAHQRYWFTPLVDDTDAPDSLTAQLVAATGLPAMNTGGTVGTAAWVFARSILKSADIAVVGMDFGYYYDTPLEQTQSWNMLGGDPAMYPSFVNPLGQRFYTDATYAWYKGNFLTLLAENNATVKNCSGAGLFFGAGVGWMELEAWLASC